MWQYRLVFLDLDRQEHENAYDTLDELVAFAKRLLPGELRSATIYDPDGRSMPAPAFAKLYLGRP